MSGLFGGGNGESQEIYAGIQVTTSMYGNPIPYVAGRQRLPMTLMWYGNFQVTTNNAGGGKGGGSSNKTYAYSAAWIAALCLGPIPGINRIWHDSGLWDNGQATNLSDEGLVLALGGSGQAVWANYPSGTPLGQQLPYDHIAYVAAANYQFGSSPSMPNLTFEVEGPIGGYSDAHSMFDCDLTAFLPDYLQDPVRGSGFMGTIMPLTGTTDSVQAYCMALGLMASPYEDSQRSAADCLKETFQIMNVDSFISVGQLKLLPLGDSPVSATTADGTFWSWHPNALNNPVFDFTDDWYCPAKGDMPVKLTQKALNQTHNALNLTFSDRSNYYNQSPVNASIRDDIAATGMRLMTGVDLKQITVGSTAITVASLILRADRYEMNTYEFRVDQAGGAVIEPLDYVTLEEAGLGLVHQVARVTETNEDANGFITIKAVKIPGATRSVVQYNWGSAAGFFANYATAPGSVLNSPPPAIFMMPPIPAADWTAGGIPIGIAVGPGSSQPFWLGCSVWMSIDGGTTYMRLGKLPAACRYGTLSASLAAGSANGALDNTNTCAITLGNTTQQLGAVTHADADSMQTLVLVGSGATTEVMSFGAAALVSAGNYNLTYLYRGLFGSKTQAHSSGDRFVRLDGNIYVVDLDPGYAGKQLFFKFTSFNLWTQAEEQVSAVTAYSYTVPAANALGGNVALIPRGSCALSGSTLYKAAGAASAWDSDAVSAQPYQQLAISAQFSFGNAQGVGLVTSTASTLDPETNMNFCIYPHSAVSATEIVESGVVRATLPAPQPGDAYSIVYDNQQVKYFINGNLEWVTSAPGLTLYAGLAIFTATSVFTNVAADWGAAATPSQWIAGAVCSVNDTNAIKFAGVSGVWGSSSWVASILGYSSCHITAKPNGVGANAVVFGLCTAAHQSQFQSANGTGAPNPAYNILDYGWDCAGSSYSNAWVAFEAGVVKFTGPAPKVTDVAWVAWDGTNVKYYLNDPTTAVYTSAAPPTAGSSLFGAAVFFNTGDGINSLRFASGTNLAVIDTGQLTSGAVSVLAAGSYSTPTAMVASLIDYLDVTVVVPPGWTYPVLVTGTVDATISSATGSFEIYLDGSALPSTQHGWNSTANQNFTCAFTYMTNLAAGSHTFSVKGINTSGGATFEQCTLQASLLKK